MSYRGQSRRRSFGVRRILVVTVILSLLLPGWIFRPAPTAAAGEFITWPGGYDYTVFGANETVEIDIGAIRYVTQSNCPTFPDGERGNGDFVVPTATIYVIRSGTLPAVTQEYHDYTGSPNTVLATTSGAFTDQIIAFTAPGPAIAVM